MATTFTTTRFAATLCASTGVWGLFTPAQARAACMRTRDHVQLLLAGVPLF